ncbi:hypothetical protein HZA39_00455 [Candidatus Peregrinibacteria bacterium]|nr:hypothetical protein [Candidatus Peregrinibacteria bacterium]
MNCNQCGLQFEYFNAEKEAYNRADALLPVNCPQCRRLRHLIFRNEKNLFHNKSCLSAKKIISLYPETSPFHIVDQNEWWSDKFDATLFARNFDFNKPFFEQYKNLQKEVPRWARIVVNAENSDFCNNSANVKNCYLTFSSYESQDLYYCMRLFRCNDCVDCLNISDCQLCSMSADCKHCYNIHYSLLCNSCYDSYFIFDCKTSKNCIMTAQARNKEYLIRGKEYSKAEYEKHKKEFLAQLANNPDSIKKEFLELLKSAYHKNLNMIKAENCLGNFINDSKNIINVFYTIDSEDCVNVYDSSALKDCYDNSYNEKSELCVEIDTAYEMYNSKFCTYSITMADSAYCDQCDHLTECFGCIGLKKQQNRILNKQYSAEDYKKMLAKIKTHMEHTGEWGKPFPHNLTPFPYNITLAYELAPLKKEEALKQGYMWHDEEKQEMPKEKYNLPKTAVEADESICEKILVCEKTGKPYKIIPQELKFYKKFGLPLPRVTPDQRYKELRNLQPPKKLIDATCGLCKSPIKTVYPPEWNYKIICEKCYLEKIYE